MNREQLETLNVIQHVLRGLTAATLTTNPQAATAMSAMLQSVAAAPGIPAEAQRMLLDLAEFPEQIAAQQKPRQ